MFNFICSYLVSCDSDEDCASIAYYGRFWHCEDGKCIDCKDGWQCSGSKYSIWLFLETYTWPNYVLQKLNKEKNWNILFVGCDYDWECQESGYKECVSGGSCQGKFPKYWTSYIENMNCTSSRAQIYNPLVQS